MINYAFAIYNETTGLIDPFDEWTDINPDGGGGYSFIVNIFSFLNSIPSYSNSDLNRFTLTICGYNCYALLWYDSSMLFLVQTTTVK